MARTAAMMPDKISNATARPSKQMINVKELFFPQENPNAANKNP